MRKLFSYTYSIRENLFYKDRNKINTLYFEYKVQKIKNKV